MRFLIDASMPRSASNVLAEFGHEAIDVRDIGLRNAPDERIAARARENGETLVSRDFDFADIRNYPPGEFCGIVVLKLPEHTAATYG